MKRTLLPIVLSAALAAPALAGGTISFSIDAQNQQDVNGIKTVLGMYSVFNDVKTNGHITQNGLNNLAALGQRGSGNVSVIHQEGNNHGASLSQHGNDNAYGIFQFGKGAQGHVSQIGNGEAGLLFQLGL